MDNDLQTLRRTFGATQERFAGLMGLPLRTYEDIEAGRAKLREIHIRAAQFAAMQLAADGNNPGALPDNLKLLARNIVTELDQVSGKP